MNCAVGRLLEALGFSAGTRSAVGAAASLQFRGRSCRLSCQLISRGKSSASLPPEPRGAGAAHSRNSYYEHVLFSHMLTLLALRGTRGTDSRGWSRSRPTPSVGLSAPELGWGWD